MSNESRELLQKINKYVGHAHHVYTTTHKDFRMSSNYGKKLELIARCQGMVSSINRFSGVENIARLILSQRKNLREILPHEMNSSYEHSLKEYNDIITLCEGILKDKLAIH